MLNCENFFFLFFSFMMLTSAFFVIFSTNTVHSVFFLILVFSNATGLLLLSEIEFIAIMLIIIYIGAITVLFLFVVMMINIKTIKNDTNQNSNYILISFIFSLVFFIETFLIFSKYFLNPNIQKYIRPINIRHQDKYTDAIYITYIDAFDEITNIENLGHLFCTYYSFFFLIAGLILLIALIGSVLLTKKEKKRQDIKIQKTYQQLSRTFLSATFNIK